jgi:paraquat-inducible protein B
MTENIDPEEFPQAVPVRKRKMRLSVVWIIPILAALVALGIAVQSYLSKGPTITIIFKSAEGLEAGKTAIKYKDIHIGKVSAVRLSHDYSKIEVTAKIEKHAEGLIVEDSKFWVVRPQVTLSGITGLSTLLSGNYIGIDPGKSKQRGKHYVGIEVAPVVTSGQPGREFLLRAEDLGPVSVGTPLYYRRLNVGQVIAADLAKDGKSFDIKVFVHAPYDKYVSQDTRFWQAGGVDVSMGAGGFTVKTQSLLSVLVGGIAFESPPDAAPNPAPANAVFTLYNDRTTAFKKVETVVQYYSLNFAESLRGLSVGAPVTFMGMPVGEVADVGLEFNPKTFGLRPHVKVALYPSRFVTHLPKGAAVPKTPTTPKERQAFVQRLVDRGLRAQLQTGSFISGQLFVALEYFPMASKASIDWAQDPPEFPVVAGGLAPFEDKVMTILTKLEKLPLDDISRDLRKVLGTLDQGLKDVNGMVVNVDGEIRRLMPEVKKALGSLDRSLQNANKILARADEEILPGVTKTLEDLQRSVAAAERVLANTDAALLGPDAPAQQELRKTMQELSRAARGIRLIADYFERHPESLIRGKNQK